MTVSFHLYGEQFFPGTGPLTDIGEQRGKFYSLNVPLRAGADDTTFHRLFKPIMSKVVEVFGPSAIVLQCGEDLELAVLYCALSSPSWGLLHLRY